ncbi:MAG: hypothetical protein ACJ73V_08465 [Acidimicrobiia bacterium]
MKAKATELGGIASGQTEAIERVSMDAREKVKQTAAMEARRIDERVAASHDAIRKAATKETVAFEESLRERLVELEDALRAQATQTSYDMRRAADEEAAAFDKIASKRVAELQDAVRDHSELLEELTRIHTSTTEQLEEARSLVGELHQAAQERQAELDVESERQASMLVPGMAPGGDGGPPASTPDLRGLDHDGRPVGIETQAEELFAGLYGYVERSEAAQRALEERLADLEDEVAESAEALEARVANTLAGVSTEELEQALAATTSGFEAKLRASADEHARKLEAAGVVTKNQLLEALARAEDGLTQAAEARASDLGEMIAAARTTIERAANSRVESLESTAIELRDGIEDLHRDIAAALTQSGEAQSAALDRAARDWLKRIDKNGAKGGRRRRTAPGAAAVVVAIAAALGGTMFFRGGGSDRPSVARADSPSPRTSAPASSTSTPGDASQVGDVASALSSISWPSATAPLGWRAPTTGSQPGTNGSAPSNGSGTGTGAATPSGGGGGGQAAPPATPAPTQSPPQTQPPPPTILPPITLPAVTLPLPDLR